MISRENSISPGRAAGIPETAFSRYVSFLYRIRAFRDVSYKNALPVRFGKKTREKHGVLARFRVFNIVSGNYLNKRPANTILFLKFLTSTIMEFKKALTERFRIHGCDYVFEKEAGGGWYVFRQTSPGGAVHFELVKPVRRGDMEYYPADSAWGRFGFTYSGTERQMWAAINRKLPVLMERDAENERMRQKRAELKMLSVRRK